MATLFEQLGGEPVLLAIIERFVDRVVQDPMIGFFFRRTNRQRLRAKEYEFAAQHLGAGSVYTGRPIDQVHAPHPIRNGLFMRRLQLLKETLEEFSVPEAVRNHWLSHTESLRSAVVGPRSPCESETGPERSTVPSEGES